VTTPDRPAIPLTLRDLGRLAYRPALEEQRLAHAAVLAGEASGFLLLVEHEPVVTLGRRGNRAGLRDPDALAQLGIPVVHSERGGGVTYHGPGQLVAYPVLRLRDFSLDVRSYVVALEAVVLAVLASYGCEGRRDPAMHGVFSDHGKIASVGVRVSRGVTSHGVALNVNPDPTHWACIDPCAQPGVRAATLAAELGRIPTLAEVRERFLAAFQREFGACLRSIERTE
jgi:lipoate-protein ligase B